MLNRVTWRNILYYMYVQYMYVQTSTSSNNNNIIIIIIVIIIIIMFYFRQTSIYSIKILKVYIEIKIVLKN